MNIQDKNKKLFFLNPKSSILNQGFTLVELLVVMSIIGVLAAIGLTSFTTAQMRGRDVQRKSDLKQTANALELYYADYGRYPDSITFGTQFTDGKTIYFKTLPVDPTSDRTYSYRIVPSSSNQKFQLFARLENSQDQDCIDANCALNPNFAITSANTNATE